MANCSNQGTSNVTEAVHSLFPLCVYAAAFIIFYIALTARAVAEPKTHINFKGLKFSVFWCILCDSTLNYFSCSVFDTKHVAGLPTKLPL